MSRKLLTKRERRKEFMRKQYEIQTGKPWDSQYDSASQESRSPPGHRDVWRSVSSAEAKAMNVAKGVSKRHRKSRKTRKNRSRRRH